MGTCRDVSLMGGPAPRAVLMVLIALGIVSRAGVCAAQAIGGGGPPTVAATGAPGQPPSSEDPPAAPDRAAQERRRWSVFLYHSLMTDNSLWEVIRGTVTPRYGYMDSIDISYEVAHENVFQLKAAGDSAILRPFAGSLYIAATFTRRGDDPRGTILEFAPYVLWRTRSMPLGGPFGTRFSLGNGVSFVTHAPEREGGQRLLNYLVAEETLGLTSHGEAELVLRLHHRCTAWGLYGDGASTNAIGLGVRISF
jgi:hypothetical protein